jgi:hypothetical protein
MVMLKAFIWISVLMISFASGAVPSGPLSDGTCWFEEVPDFSIPEKFNAFDVAKLIQEHGARHVNTALLFKMISELKADTSSGGSEVSTLQGALILKLIKVAEAHPEVLLVPQKNGKFTFRPGNPFSKAISLIKTAPSRILAEDVVLLHILDFIEEKFYDSKEQETMVREIAGAVWFRLTRGFSKGSQPWFPVAHSAKILRKIFLAPRLSETTVDTLHEAIVQGHVLGVWSEQDVGRANGGEYDELLDLINAYRANMLRTSRSKLPTVKI